MNMPGFAAEAELFRTGGHYRTDRRVATSLAQRAAAIRPAVGMSHGASFAQPIRTARVPVLGPVVAIPMNVSGVYRDANGKCQLGTGGADHNVVVGMENAMCQVKCGTMMSQPCPVEDGQGGCTVACNCDILHKTCRDVGEGGFGGFGSDIPITEGIGL